MIAYLRGVLQCSGEIRIAEHHKTSGKVGVGVPGWGRKRQWVYITTLTRIRFDGDGQWC